MSCWTAPCARATCAPSHRESRGFHFALLRTGADAGDSWGMVGVGVEPHRAQLADGAFHPRLNRLRLHADHREMLTAFVAGDVTALLSCAAAHHGRLLDAVAAFPLGEALVHGLAYNGLLPDFEPRRPHIC